MKRDLKLHALLGGLSILMIAVACFIGSTPIGPLRGLTALVGLGSPTDQLVMQSIRLPRALSAFVVGGALGMSGAALQGLLRNPLAEPGVLGVTAASSFGATLTIFTGLAALFPLAVPLGAILGALFATYLLTLLAYRLQSVVALILVGVTLSSFIGALMSLTLSLAPNPFSTAELLNWSFGSVANRSWTDLGVAAPGLILGTVILSRVRRGLGILTLGEDVAATSGLDLKAHRRAVIAGAGLATGSAVALAGAIGFVGIIAPHVVRPWVRHDPGRTLVPSFLVGGVALLLADMTIRVLPVGGSLRLGVAAALVGAPLFAIIAVREARS